MKEDIERLGRLGKIRCRLGRLGRFGTIRFRLGRLGKTTLRLGLGKIRKD